MKILCQFSKSYIQNIRLARFFSKEKYFLKKIAEIKPDLIAFSVLTSNYRWALNLSKAIKQRFNIPIIFGGIHPTLVPETVLREPSVDMVCVGEAEEALLELADNFGTRTEIRNIYFKSGDTIIKNSLRPLEQNLDKYPFPDEGIFYEVLPPSYRLSSSIMTSRGCPFYCTYCGNQSIALLYKGQKYVRRRSVENVLAELIERKNRFKTKHFVFMDDIFAGDEVWLEKFIDKYTQDVRLPFNCLAHPALFNRKIAGLLKEGGYTTVDFGLQTGSQRLRRETLHRFEKNESMIEAASACKEYKLHFAVDQILNIPGETEGDMLSSAELFNTIRPDIINCFNLIYFPKAKIIEKACALGLLTEKNIYDIEAGNPETLYGSASLTASNKASSYQKYALFLSSLPLLPKKYVAKLLIKRKLNFFAGLPLSFLPFIKILVDLKGGLGFIPLAVIKNELFYLRQHFLYRKDLKK